MKTRKNRVAVISKKPRLIEFFRLEAQACGCSALVMAEPPATLRDYERVILDTDAGACVADHADCRVAAVMTDSQIPPSVPTDEVWEWPISIETVRAFLEGVLPVSDESRGVEDPRLHLLSRERRELLVRNRRVILTPLEWRLLLALNEGRGETVSRDRLRRLVGDEQGNKADVYIHHLRKKLEGESGVRLIYTVRAEGYRLGAELVDHEPVIS